MTKTSAAVTKTLQQMPPLTTYAGNSSVVTASMRTRPLWFDGRFLSARDLERDQNYFLAQQANLGRAAGFGVIHGLIVETVSSGGSIDAETLIIGAGQGLTPGGQPVVISQDLTVRISDLVEEETLEVQFGVSVDPTPVERTRTGLYVLALRPVQFTANPITSYPASIQGSPTHDGDIVEATAVSLIPYPDPAGNFDATTRLAAIARQIFVTENLGSLSDSLLPLAMLSIQRGAIEWVDVWLVRRDSGPEASGLRFGLNDPSTQQAYLLQYDSQLQSAVATFNTQSLPAKFAATDYFQALPSAGRFPFASIDPVALTQLFFPPQTDVLLSLIPIDELPAVMEDSLSLPPIDLTLPAASYADLAVLLLVPVSRAVFATQATQLTPVELSAALPQVLSNQKPLDLLKFFPNNPAPSSGGSSPWQQAIGDQIYGYYVRRRSSPLLSTTTTLSASIGGEGSEITLRATVSPSAATGVIIFQDNSVTVGSVDVTDGSEGVRITPVAPGPHQLVAVYQGDANFASSTSTATSLITSTPPPPTSTTITLTATALPGAGQGLPYAYNLTATVSPMTATGTVRILEGAANLGSASLTDGYAVVLLGSESLSMGQHSVTAAYSGDANFTSSTSTPATLTGTGGQGS